MVEDLLDETGVQGMSRPVGNQMPDERQAEKREVTDQVEYFVADEFV